MLFLETYCLKMKKIKSIFILSILIVALHSCGGFDDAKKVLTNQKTNTTDEFLIKKRDPLTLPPDYDKLPEPGSNKEIADFCENTYGVKFPMFAKSKVKGPNANKLFLDLAEMSEEPRWNFHKYLIDRDGNFVKSYSSFTSPKSRKLIKDIESLLKLTT